MMGRLALVAGLSLLSHLASPLKVVDDACPKVMPKPRMLNSTIVKDKQLYPFMVSIFWTNITNPLTLKPVDKYMHACGGSVISSRFILTALHCLIEFNSTEPISMSPLISENSVVVVAGDYNICEEEPDSECVSEVESITKNDYSDIALIKTRQNLFCHERIRAICLPKSATVDHSSLVAMGWGMTEKGYNIVHRSILRHAEMKVFVNSRCTSPNDTGSNKFCVISATSDPYKGPNHMDSGGPLVQMSKDGRNIIVGVVQSILEDADVPYGLQYMNILYFKNWIRGIVADVCFA